MCLFGDQLRTADSQSHGLSHLDSMLDQERCDVIGGEGGAESPDRVNSSHKAPRLIGQQTDSTVNERRRDAPRADRSIDQIDQ